MLRAPFSDKLIKNNYTRLVTMRKYLLDLTVTHVEMLSSKHVLLKLTRQEPLPPMLPGQFVEVKVDNSTETFLRRPISINYVDEAKNELWLLVAMIGAGTRALGQLKVGQQLNCLLPLGNGFTIPTDSYDKPLLIGGGVGTAPLLYYGKVLNDKHIRPTFLLGGRSASDILQLDLFRSLGDVFVTTEDGSMGQQGFVTNHTVLHERQFTRISTCGPKPMMKAVAGFAVKNNITCEASLENQMACGLGACLCCVEKTTSGNLCVCKQGPVFNVKNLLWQI